MRHRAPPSEAQREAVRRFAEAEGLDIIREHTEVETGRGADALDRRPELASALASGRGPTASMRRRSNISARRRDRSIFPRQQCWPGWNSRANSKTRGLPRSSSLLSGIAMYFSLSILTQTEVQQNHVRLQTRLADDLALVPADRVHLQQVIMNLLVNAVEAMSSVADGSRELTIASGKDDPNAVFVEVQDTGPGIDPAELDRLFQSFYTTKPEGIGMGLAISRSIVEAHGGRLAAAPNKPRGAVFRFTLLADEEPSERTRAIGTPPQAKISGDRSAS
jgi:anti-sigma regulatory factor (Ser/Thr protein kinase)